MNVIIMLDKCVAVRSACAYKVMSFGPVSFMPAFAHDASFVSITAGGVLFASHLFIFCLRHPRKKLESRATGPRFPSLSWMPKLKT